MADLDSKLPTQDGADGSDGTSAPSLTQQVGGMDGSGNLQTLSTDTVGKLNVNATAQPGVDVGDVTINNTSGAGAVNIQDGGNSITVDGTVTANAGTGNFGVNLTQVASNTVNTGIGAAGTGTQRVSVSSDSSITLNASANIIGNVRIDQTTPGTTNGVVVNSSALPLGASSATNQSTAITALGTINTSLGVTQPRNVSQIAGNAINTGTGAAASGTQRVAVSTDSNILVTQSAPNTVANAWPIKLTDGTSTTAVKAASTAAVATDPSVVVALSPNSPIPAGTSSIGQVTANAGTNLNTSALALSATQTNGTQKTQIVDSSNVVIGQTTINSLNRINAVLPSNGATGSSVPFNAEYVAGKDLSGNLQPLPSNTIDLGNSSASILTANSTFTGTWQDVTNFSNLTTLVFTDQVSAVDGLKIEYSTDGVNIDDNDLFTIPASNGQQISSALPVKYYRIRYVNGTTTQTVFRLQTKLHANRPKPSTQRIGTPVNYEQDAELVIATTARLSLTGSAPTFATIGIASGTVIASNANRKGLVIQNTSSLATVSLNIVAGTAVLNSGITLYPHDIWYMDEWTFTTSQINAISSLASTNISIQELS